MGSTGPRDTVNGGAPSTWVDWGPVGLGRLCVDRPIAHQRGIPRRTQYASPYPAVAQLENVAFFGNFSVLGSRKNTVTNPLTLEKNASEASSPASGASGPRGVEGAQPPAKI